MFREPTSDADLRELADRMGIQLNGIVTEQNMPELKAGEAYIFNLDNENKYGGTHWTCLQTYAEPDPDFEARVLYVDSYGMPPPEYVLKAMRQFTRTQGIPIYNDVQYQTKEGQECGFWCLYVLKRLQSGMKPVDLFYADKFTHRPVVANRRKLLSIIKSFL